MSHLLRLAASCLGFASFALAPLAAANQVHTVGPPGTADFSVLQDAVNAAGAGDILLIDDGQYLDTVIDGKSITLIGDGAGPRPGVHRLVIKNIAANQKVVVRGLDSLTAMFLVPDVLEVVNCAGPVLFEDCVFAPQGNFPPAPPGDAPLALVQQSSRVVFTRSTLASPPAPTSSSFAVFLPGVALRVEGSSVTLYDSTVIGGRGGAANLPPFSLPVPATAGSHAIELASGTVFAAGCTISGGTGGDGALINGQCSGEGSGGDGIHVGGTLRRMDSGILGGAAGVPVVGCPAAGSAGAGVVVEPGGSVVVYPDALRRFVATTPGVEGGAVANAITGVAGEPVVLLVSLVPAGEFVPGLRGTLITGSPVTAFALGPIPPSGTLQFSVAIPVNGLPPGVEGIEVYEQCAVPGATGNGLLTTPCVVVVIDDAV